MKHGDIEVAMEWAKGGQLKNVLRLEVLRQREKIAALSAERDALALELADHCAAIGCDHLTDKTKSIERARLVAEIVKEAIEHLGRCDGTLTGSPLSKACWSLAAHDDGIEKIK